MAFARWLERQTGCLINAPFCVRHIECGLCKKKEWAFRVREMNDTAEYLSGSVGITYPVCKKCEDSIPF